MSRYHRTGRDDWTAPRAPSDPLLRRLQYGRILPMEKERRPRRLRIGVIALVVIVAAAIYGASL